MAMAYKIEICGSIVSDGDGWLYDYLDIPCAYPKKIKEELKKANGQPIEIWINSGGGNVASGSEIYNLIGSYKGKKKAVIIQAYSAASVIACACESEIATTAVFMLHRASTYASGNRNDMEDATEMLETFDNTIADAYIKKTGKSREEILGLMDKTTWLTPDEAIENGFCDRKYDFDASGDGSNVVYNSNDIPSEAFEKIKNILMEKKIREMEGEKKGMEHENNAVATITTGSVCQPNDEIPKMKVGGGIQQDGIESAQDIVNKYPDYVNEIVAMERKRIQEIDAIAGAIADKKLVDDAKYGHPISAKDLSYKSMLADSSAGVAHNTASIIDTMESGVSDVLPGTGEPEDKGDDPESAKRKNALMNAFKK